MGHRDHRLARRRQERGGLVAAAKKGGEQEEKGAATKRPDAPTPPPLWRVAAAYPRLSPETKTMKAAECAKLVNVSADQVIGYALRAPLDVDGEPILSETVLTVVMVDGSKTAVKHPL